MNYIKLPTLFFALAFLLSACQSTPDQYYWGSYEQTVYDMYHKPGKAVPDTQILRLTQTLEEAQSEGLQAAPGIHAHLGMMYRARGDSASAQWAFNQEMLLYPDSRNFIGKLLQKKEITVSETTLVNARLDDKGPNNEGPDNKKRDSENSDPQSSVAEGAEY